MHRRHLMAALTMLSSLPAWAQTNTDLPPPPPINDPAPAVGAARHQPELAGTALGPPASPASARHQQLPTVTIREFRSSVAEVSPRGATDMFISALVKTRRFRVLERSRLAEGIGAEKALNQQGLTTGQSGQAQFLGATYLFEATVSEASSGDNRTAFTLGIAGATGGKATSTDSIAIDVRVSDVESGIVVDAVDVRKLIKSTETRVGGLFSALTNVATRGRGSELASLVAPTDEYVSARKDSIDKTLREAIDEAVDTIAKRFAKD